MLSTRARFTLSNKEIYFTTGLDNVLKPAKKNVYTSKQK